MELEISEKDNAIKAFKENIGRFESELSEKNSKINDLIAEITNLGLKSQIEVSVKNSPQKEPVLDTKKQADFDEKIKELSIQLKTAREELEVCDVALI